MSIMGDDKKLIDHIKKTYEEKLHLKLSYADIIRAALTKLKLELDK